MKHITEIQAEQYVNNRAGVLISVSIKKHLDRCGKCRDLIEKTRDDKSLLQEVRDAVKEIPDTAPDKLKKDTLLTIRKKLESKGLTVE